MTLCRLHTELDVVDVTTTLPNPSTTKNYGTNICIIILLSSVCNHAEDPNSYKLSLTFSMIYQWQIKLLRRGRRSITRKGCITTTASSQVHVVYHIRLTTRMAIGCIIVLCAVI